MSAVGGRREDGSGSAGHLQAVAGIEELLRVHDASYGMGAYHRLLEHGQSCPKCAEEVCPEARDLWRAVKLREP